MHAFIQEIPLVVLHILIAFSGDFEKKLIKCDAVGQLEHSQYCTINY